MFDPNATFPQLHRDAPAVPQGMAPKEGVEYGCGDAACSECYEPKPQARRVEVRNG